jgi:hypothetical protein
VRVLPRRPSAGRTAPAHRTALRRRTAPDRAFDRFCEHLAESDGRDRGDVPGWVLVTLMTAGLVLAIWALAGPALTNLFTTAIQRVTSFGG